MNCGVYELMVDVVEHWLRERDIRASRTDWDALVERLREVEKQLESRYRCQRRSVIVSGYEAES